ncbi:MAG TPA: dienelactone hydrolase family protein [Candidatus Saccharimonadales bacterium]|nr:dienelactone hydrolase family protein [Candidatus Saccharimonadales bacterium]
MQDKTVTIETDQTSFEAYLIKPPGLIKGGLIVIHEVWGLADHIKDVARRFASDGYCVLAPDLLSQTGITEKAGELQKELFDPEKRAQAQPKIREMMAPIMSPEFAVETIAKVKSCYEYLSSTEETKSRVAITGFCFGGTYSFSLAIAEPRLKAAIPFYGHCDATVEELRKIKCPILAFYGEKDEGLMGGLDDLTKNMQEAGVDFTPKVYPNCGHAFFNDSNSFTYNKEAASDSWLKTLEFLNSNISK